MDTFAEMVISLPREFSLVAVDGGGSKTECAVINQDGKVLGIGRGGPSRIPYVGIEDSIIGLREALGNALSGIDLHAEPILVVCTHRIQESEPLRSVIGEFFKCPIVKGTDSDAAFGAAGVFSTWDSPCRRYRRYYVGICGRRKACDGWRVGYGLRR